MAYWGLKKMLIEALPPSSCSSSQPHQYHSFSQTRSLNKFWVYKNYYSQVLKSQMSLLLLRYYFQRIHCKAFPFSQSLKLEKEIIIAFRFLKGKMVNLALKKMIPLKLAFRPIVVPHYARINANNMLLITKVNQISLFSIHIWQLLKTRDVHIYGTTFKW